MYWLLQYTYTYILLFILSMYIYMYNYIYDKRTRKCIYNNNAFVCIYDIYYILISELQCQNNKTFSIFKRVAQTQKVLTNTINFDKFQQYLTLLPKILRIFSIYICCKRRSLLFSLTIFFFRAFLFLMLIFLSLNPFYQKKMKHFVNIYI